MIQKSRDFSMLLGPRALLFQYALLQAHVCLFRFSIRSNRKDDASRREPDGGSAEVSSDVPRALKRRQRVPSGQTPLTIVSTHPTLQYTAVDYMYVCSPLVTFRVPHKAAQKRKEMKRMTRCRSFLFPLCVMMTIER